MYCSTQATAECFAKLEESLAAYKDTGLEPEEVAELKARFDAHWLEIFKAEEQGRLIVLPCKVGDTVYKVWYDPCHNGEKYPDSYGCSGCEDVCDIKKSIHEIKAPSVDWILRQLHNGSFVYFLTREEAEAAMGGDHDAAD
jgi:hypothetical protein